MTPPAKQLNRRGVNQRVTWRDADAGEMLPTLATDEAMPTAAERPTEKRTKETHPRGGQPATADRHSRGRSRDHHMSYETILGFAPQRNGRIAKLFRSHPAARETNRRCSA